MENVSKKLPEEWQEANRCTGCKITTAMGQIKMDIQRSRERPTADMSSYIPVQAVSNVYFLIVHYRTQYQSLRQWVVELPSGYWTLENKAIRTILI